MPARTVCISRTLAAGGEEIGQAVAERLGWRVIDAEIIQRAAEKAGIDPTKVAQTEQRQSLIRRLIASIAFAEPRASCRRSTAPSIPRRPSPPARPWRSACAD